MKLDTLRFVLKSAAVGLLAALLIVVLQEHEDRSRPRSAAAVPEAVPPPQPLSAAAPEPYSPPPASYAEAVAKAAPAVVNVTIETTVAEAPSPLLQDPVFREFFGDALDRLNPPSRRRRFGSAVVLNDQGHLITNYHVVAGAESIDITLSDGRSGKARLMGYDVETDIAVLATELDRLPHIEIGDITSLRVGDVVLAIGNPFGVGQTVTQGIVSGTGRNRLGIATFENFIQTDAAVNPGNSGGALINTHGELMGINTAILSKTAGAEGISFAIPIDLVRSVLTQILVHGSVVRGWLGLEARRASGTAAGIVVTRVIDGSPADEAGVRVNDLLRGVGGLPISDARDAVDLIAAMRPGQVTDLEIVRDGELMRLAVTVGQRPRL